MRDWWTAVDPATVEVACGEEQHRISWRRGKLVLEDHDLAAEESFVALGGDPALCLEVLRAWRSAVDDREVLWFWDAPRVGNADMAQMLANVRAQQQQTLASYRQMVATGTLRGVPGAPARPIPREMLDRFRTQMAVDHRRALLSALPEELRMRLGLSAIVRAARQRRAGPWFRSRAEDLQTALSSRAAPAVQQSMRAWRRRMSSHHSLIVESWIARPGEPANLCGLVDDAGGWAAACLPLEWLVDVWARGVAVVDGCFVLEVAGEGQSPDRLPVTAARWERCLPAGSTPVVEPAVAFRVDGGWRLRWDS
jgi:hypothetical protein